MKKATEKKIQSIQKKLDKLTDNYLDKLLKEAKDRGEDKGEIIHYFFEAKRILLQELNFYKITKLTMPTYNLNNTIIIKQDHNQNYYLFLQDKKGNDIFINGNIARLELKKSQPIFDTLNGQIGTLQFSPSKKELRYKTIRFAGESRDYKMIGGKGRAFNSDFGYWEVKEVYEPINEYLLETIYYHLRMDLMNKIKENENYLNTPSLKKTQEQTKLLSPNVSNMNIGGWFSSEKDRKDYEENLKLVNKYKNEIQDYKEKLADLYRWELEWERRTKKSIDLLKTNPHHVERIKKQIKELTH
jgi:hypothetical protein